MFMLYKEFNGIVYLYFIDVVEIIRFLVSCTYFISTVILNYYDSNSR